MDAQHGRQRKRRPDSLIFGVVRRNQFDQRRPKNYLIHLVKEHLLAGFLHAEIQRQDGLFNGLYSLSWGLYRAHN